MGKGKGGKRLRKEKPPFWQDQKSITDLCVSFLLGIEYARCMSEGVSPAKKDKALQLAVEAGKRLGEVLYQKGLSSCAKGTGES